MDELQNHGTQTIHAGQSRSFEEVVGLCSLSGGLYQELHSYTIGSRQDSIRGLAWEEAIIKGFPCIWILGFVLCSETETKEAGLQSHSWQMHWVQRID
jgi:hypothetical protein